MLALTPLHWLLLSLTAWRAVDQLAVSPYRWEKTSMGWPKPLHRNARVTRALVALERQLSVLKESGEIPVLPDEARWLRGRSRRPAA